MRSRMLVAVVFWLCTVGCTRNGRDEIEPIWRPFEMSEFVAARKLGLPVIVCTTTSTTLALNIDEPPTFSKQTRTILRKNDALLFELEFRKMRDLPPSFIDEYIGRQIPSISIVYADNKTERVTGLVDVAKIEGMLNSLDMWEREGSRTR